MLLGLTDPKAGKTVLFGFDLAATLTSPFNESGVAGNWPVILS
jgi:hypothetical protein